MKFSPKSLGLAMVLAPLFLSPAYAGDKPDQNGCYESNWFYPWLDLPSTNCTHPALGDPDHTAPIPSAVGQPRKEPPPHCPYDKGAVK